MSPDRQRLSFSRERSLFSRHPQMRIQITTDDTLIQKFRDHAASTVPSARRLLADRLRQEALADLTRETPVRTGRLQQGWIAAATGQGSEGTSREADLAGRSHRAATNQVDYVGYVEYGTSRMAPRRLARAALSRVRRLAAVLFRLG